VATCHVWRWHAHCTFLLADTWKYQFTTKSSAAAKRTGRQLSAFVSSQCSSRAFGFFELSYTLRVRLITNLHGNGRMQVCKNSTHSFWGISSYSLPPSLNFKYATVPNAHWLCVCQASGKTVDWQERAIFFNYLVKQQRPRRRFASLFQSVARRQWRRLVNQNVIQRHYHAATWQHNNPILQSLH